MDNKEYKEKEFRNLILPQLRASPDGITIPELVLKTGLSNDWTEFTLRKLMDEYKARIELNDKQQLVYIFDFTEAEEVPSWKQALRKFLEASWAVFVFAFKAWIVLMLCTYLLFNALVLAIALTAITRNSGIVNDAFEVLGKVLKGIYDALFRKDKLDKGVLHEVFSFVFGASQSTTPDTEKTKELLQQIQYNEGRITIAEIVQVTGKSIREAEERATKLLANHQGDVEVSEQGVIVYTFPDFVHKTADAQPAPKIWNNLLPLIKMNDNDQKANDNIIIVNTFNLVMAIIAPFIIDFMVFGEYRTMPESWLFFSSTFPFLFSAIFFLVPFCRSFFVRAKNKKIRKLNDSYQFLEELFTKMPRVYPEDIVNKTLLERKAIELEGENKLDEAGNMYYDFEKIERELKSI